MGAYILQKLVKIGYAAIPAKASVFMKQFSRQFFGAFCCFPLLRECDLGYDPHRSKNGRLLINAMKEGKWYPYAPEGHRVDGAIGDFSSSALNQLVVGERFGAVCYVVEVEYLSKGWKIWVPGSKTIVRVEKFHCNGRSAEEIAPDVKNKLTYLNRLPARDD
jgi:hypothetical protein